MIGINFDNCVNFQTSLGNPSLGIPCDLTFLYGKRHPFPNSRGNVVYRMVLSMTLTLVIFSGLWCTEAATCTFTFGGLFTTTSPRKLLFDGYTEPSVLKYYNLKYAKYNVSFQCANEPFDQCGDQLYSCDSDGVVMKLPYDNEKLLLYGATEKDEYYAPYFVVNVDNGELVWPFSFNKTLADLSKQRMIEGNYTRINNPFYTAYPAWDTNDIDFNRLFQCSKRTLGGMPGLFPSCEDTLATGVDDVLNAFKLIKFQGNESVYFFDTPLAVDGATEENQLSAYLWDGFLSYPYNYLGSTAGPNYRTLRNPILFSKQHSMNFELSQDLLKFDFEKDIDLGVPFRTTSNPSFLASVNARRFVEDRSTWQRLRTLGTPTDFFGMPYIVPEGMASLEKLTGFPVFAGTPHNYGNLNFGGREYTHVTGAEPNADSQRTFVDYDPITGRGHRRAFRQQVRYTFKIVLVMCSHDLYTY